MSRKTGQPVPISGADWVRARTLLALNIQRYRVRRGLSHRDLAAATGRSIWMSMRWCRATHVPSLRELLSLAKLFQCEMRDLLVA